MAFPVCRAACPWLNRCTFIKRIYHPFCKCKWEKWNTENFTVQDCTFALIMVYSNRSLVYELEKGH